MNKTYKTVFAEFIRLLLLAFAICILIGVGLDPLEYTYIRHTGFAYVFSFATINSYLAIILSLLGIVMQYIRDIIERSDFNKRNLPKAGFKVSIEKNNRIIIIFEAPEPSYTTKLLDFLSEIYITLIPILFSVEAISFIVFLVFSSFATDTLIGDTRSRASLILFLSREIIKHLCLFIYLFFVHLDLPMENIRKQVVALLFYLAIFQVFAYLTTNVYDLGIIRTQVPTNLNGFLQNNLFSIGSALVFFSIIKLRRVRDTKGTLIYLKTGLLWLISIHLSIYFIITIFPKTIEIV